VGREDADLIEESLDKCEPIEFKELSSSKKDLKSKEQQSKSIKLTDVGVQEADPFLTNPKEVLSKPPSKNMTGTFYKEQTGTPQRNQNQSKGIEAAIKRKEASIE
jgi:hypothetical protein